MPIRIREAVQEDVPRLLDIYNDAVLHSVATFDLVPKTMSEREQWFRQFGEVYPILVAEHEGRAAGYCCLTPFRHMPAYSRTAEISIYLDERIRGLGTGTQLLERMIELAKERNFHAIIAAITGGNEISVRLHRKFGFVPVGVFREVGFKFNAWQDVLFMQLLI